MKKPTKDPTEGQKKNSTKDSKKGEEMGNDKYMQFEATKQYLMSTGQLDGKTDDYINAYVENWIIGYAEGILQIARNMKEEGIPLSTIAKLTGLSLEELEKL